MNIMDLVLSPDTIEQKVSSLQIAFKRNPLEMKFPYVRHGYYVVKATEGSDELWIDQVYKGEVLRITIIPQGRHIKTLHWEPYEQQERSVFDGGAGPED